VPAELVAVESTRTYLFASEEVREYVDDVAPEIFEHVLTSVGEVQACHW
jgi:hypothetical protein